MVPGPVASQSTYRTASMPYLRSTSTRAGIPACSISSRACRCGGMPFIALPFYAQSLLNDPTVGSRRPVRLYPCQVAG